MTVELLNWLQSCPVLAGETLNLEYLPSYSGWSLSVPKSAVKRDILGSPRRSLELKITRRHTVRNNTDRIAVMEALEDLTAWAKENPPPGSNVRVTDLPAFSSRAASGVEDISITLMLTE